MTLKKLEGGWGLRSTSPRGLEIFLKMTQCYQNSYMTFSDIESDQRFSNICHNVTKSHIGHSVT